MTGFSNSGHHRFMIYGAGAIGSVFGGMLARAGHSVTLVGRNPHMEAVRNNGLSMDGLLGEHLVRDVQTATDLDMVDGKLPFSAVFISVKSSGTEEAIRKLAGSGLVGGGALLISLQNGLGNIEQIREEFGVERSFGGRVIFGAQVSRPGCVHVSVWADKVLIGGPETPAGKRSGSDLAALLTESGIETQAVDDIEAALWGKVLYNCGLNPLSALLNVAYGELGRLKNARRLLVQLIEEAFMVASREVDLPWGAADEYLEYFFEKLLPPTEAHNSSMLQDITQGRETEIDAITGQIVSRARILNIPVPVSSVIYELIKAKVGTARQPQPVNSE